MFKFTLTLGNNLSISKEEDTYQDFLKALVESEAVNKEILVWLVGFKDLRVKTNYSYWGHGRNNFTRAWLIKEKVNE